MYEIVNNFFLYYFTTITTLMHVIFVLGLGLGDAWGHRVIYTNPKEKELGSHLLQVKQSVSFCIVGSILFQDLSSKSQFLKN